MVFELTNFICVFSSLRARRMPWWIATLDSVVGPSTMSSAACWWDIGQHGDCGQRFLICLHRPSTHALSHTCFFLRCSHESLLPLGVWPLPLLPLFPLPPHSSFQRKEMGYSIYNKQQGPTVIITCLGSLLLCLIFRTFSRSLTTHGILSSMYCWHVCKNLEHLHGA